MKTTNYCKAIFLGIAIMVLGACTQSAEKKENKELTDLQTLAAWYNYSTVDWDAIDDLYYRPYSCDWSDEIGEQIHPDFPKDYAGKYWHRLQNAKTLFHQQTLPLRVTASDKTLQAINHTEAAFDTLFVNIVSQEYYMRLFVDEYQELLPHEIDVLFESMRE